MRRHAGFTLVELMAVIAVLGILGATELPCYRTIQRRACGSEATCMLKRILDAEIMYFLENEKFLPEVGQTVMIFHNDLPFKAEITQIKAAFKITIPVGHHLDYTIISMPGPACMVTISSFGNSFALFKDGSPSITRTVDKSGKVDIL